MSLPTDHHYFHHHHLQQRRRRHHHETTNISPSPSDSEESADLPKRKRAKMESTLDTDGMPAASSRVMDTDGIDNANLERISREGDVDRESEMEGEPMESTEQETTPQQEAVLFPVEAQLLPLVKYEYLDHTADVQIHAWGDNLAEAFEQCAMGMFAYITDVERVDNFGSERIEASGHDMLSLLYGFLDEWLFVFNADPYFVARKISITSFDRDNFKISSIGYGETFNLAKHTQGTEVKAITYSNMQFHEKDNYAEVFVIIDI